MAALPYADAQLHRRTIRKALIERLGTTVVSRVSGDVDVDVPAGSDAKAYADVLDREVRCLGYAPTLTILSGTGSSGQVRVTTPETLAQAGRGARRQ